MIEPILSELYELILGEKRKEKSENSTLKNKHSGYAFEDKVANRIFPVAKDLGFKLYPPRYTPAFRTFSGSSYQIDVSFSKGPLFYAIECKEKEFSTNENLYYFNAKLLDYYLAENMATVKGIYLSLSPIEETARIYALAYGLTAIDPQNPPLGYLRAKVLKDSEISKDLLRLEQQLESNRTAFKHTINENSARKMYDAYKLLLNRIQSSYGKV